MSPINPDAFKKYARIFRPPTVESAPEDVAASPVQTGPSPEELAEQDPVLDGAANPFDREIKRRKLVEFYRTEPQRAADRAAGATPTLDPSAGYGNAAQSLLNSITGQPSPSPEPAPMPSPLEGMGPLPQTPLPAPATLPPPAPEPSPVPAPPEAVAPAPPAPPPPAPEPAVQTPLTRGIPTPGSPTIAQPSAEAMATPVVLPPPPNPTAPVPAPFVPPITRELPGPSALDPNLTPGNDAPALRFVSDTNELRQPVVPSAPDLSPATGEVRLEANKRGWLDEQVDELIARVRLATGRTMNRDEASMAVTGVLEKATDRGVVGDVATGLRKSIPGMAQTLDERNAADLERGMGLNLGQPTAEKIGQGAGELAKTLSAFALGEALAPAKLLSFVENSNLAQKMASGLGMTPAKVAETLVGSQAIEMPAAVTNLRTRLDAGQDPGEALVSTLADWAVRTGSMPIQMAGGNVGEKALAGIVGGGAPAAFAGGSPRDVAEAGAHGALFNVAFSAPELAQRALIKERPVDVELRGSDLQATPAAKPGEVVIHPDEGKGADSPSPVRDQVPLEDLIPYQFLSKAQREARAKKGETTPPPAETKPPISETVATSSETKPSADETTGRLELKEAFSKDQPTSGSSNPTEGPSSASGEVSPETPRPADISEPSIPEPDTDPRLEVARRVDRVAAARRASNDGSLTEFLKSNISDPDLDSILAEALPDKFGTPPKSMPTSPTADSPGDVRRMPVSEIGLDPDRFQYKFEGIKEGRGVTGALDSSKWRDDLAGVLDVWRDPADGKTYVVNGHHRLDLAKRSNVRDVAVKYIDAPTAEKARKIGAEINISNGRGGVLDAAKYFRASGITSREQTMASDLPLTEGKVDQGVSVARLSEPVFRMAVDGRIPIDFAADLGKKIDTPGKQRRVVEQFMQKPDMSRRDFRELVNLESLSDESDPVYEGDMDQGTLDGMEGRVARSTGPERAEVLSFIRGNLEKDKRVSGMMAIAENADRLERLGLGNADSLKAKDQKASSNALLGLFEKLAYKSGSVVSDAVSEAARRILDGEIGNGPLVDRAAIKKETYERVVEALRKVVAGDFGSAFAEGTSQPVGESVRQEAGGGGERARPEERTREGAGRHDELVEGEFPDQDGGTGDLFAEPLSGSPESGRPPRAAIAPDEEGLSFAEGNTSTERIDSAERDGAIAKPVADLARVIVSRDPHIDRDLAIHIAKGVRSVLKMDEETGRPVDPEERITVRGSAAFYRIGDKWAGMAVKLYRGADARDIVHEWYHTYYARLADDDRKAFDAYARDAHREKGAEGIQERFANEGSAFWLGEEAARRDVEAKTASKRKAPPGWLKTIFGKGADSLNRLATLVKDIERLRDVPEEIRRIYRGINSIDGKIRITPEFIGEMFSRGHDTGFDFTDREVSKAEERAFVETVRRFEEGVREETGNREFSIFAQPIDDLRVGYLYRRSAESGGLEGEVEIAKDLDAGRVPVRETPRTKVSEAAKSIESEGGPRLEDLTTTRVRERMSAVVASAEKGKELTFDAEAEAKYKENRKPTPEKLTDRAVAAWNSFWSQAIGSPYRHLPVTPETMEAVETLRRLGKADSVAADRASRYLKRILEPIAKEPRSYDLFNRYVFLADLNESWKKGLYKDDDVVMGFQGREAMTRNWIKIKGAVESGGEDTAGVRKAIEVRNRIWDDVRREYSTALSEIGFKDVGTWFTNPAYFRHHVVNLFEERPEMVRFVQRKIKAPTDSAYLRRRTGANVDYATDYASIEFETLAHMARDIRTAKSIKRIRDNFDVAKDVFGEFANELEARMQRRIAKIEQDNRRGPDDIDLAEARQLIRNRDKIGDSSFTDDAADWLKKQGVEPGRLEDHVGPDHAVYYASDKSVFGSVYSVTASVANAVMKDTLELIGKNDLRRRTVDLGKRDPMVIPKKLAAQLEDMDAQAPLLDHERLTRDAGNAVMRVYKQMNLIGPGRFFKYNIRNFFGDLEAVAVGNPNAFRYVPAAARELWGALMKGEDPAGDLLEFFERGGMDSFLHIQEAGDLHRLEEMSRVAGDERSVAKRIWDAWFIPARRVSDLREGLLRFAAFKSYKEQIARNATEGKGDIPDNYGASRADRIDALENHLDKAYHLSNDLLGAYDMTSEFGQTIRKHLIPFWSFQEANAKRYAGLVRNAFRGEGKVSGAFVIPLGVVKTFLKFYGIATLAQVAAITGAGKNEEDIPEDTRNKGWYLYFGKSVKDVYTMTRLGNTADIMEWIGLDHSPRIFANALLGRYKNLGEFAEAMTAPYHLALDDPRTWPMVNKLVQGANPGGWMKTAWEILRNEQSYPDASRPRQIEDRFDYAFRSFGLGGAYKAGKNALSYMTDDVLPVPADRRRGIVQAAKDYAIEFFVYSDEAGKAQYEKLRSEAAQWIADKRNSRSGGGFASTPRSYALKNLRLALKWKDDLATKAWATEYALRGGTVHNAADSLDKLHPLASIPKKDRSSFLDSLGPERRLMIESATRYYRDNFDSKTLRRDLESAFKTPETRKAAENFKAVERTEKMEKMETTKKNQARGFKAERLLQLMEGR